MARKERKRKYQDKDPHDSKAVGHALQNLSKIEALKALPKGKEVEQFRILSGWKWMVKYRDSRLVPPHKIKFYEEQGFKVSFIAQ